MKILVVILIAAGIVWYFGFHGKDPIFQDYSSQSDYFLGHKLCPDLKPKNPYQPGSASYSDYEWAVSHPALHCEEVNRGCVEYQRQLKVYQDCTANQ